MTASDDIRSRVAAYRIDRDTWTGSKEAADAAQAKGSEVTVFEVVPLPGISPEFIALSEERLRTLEKCERMPLPIPAGVSSDALRAYSALLDAHKREVGRLQTALAAAERERDAAVAANATAQSILGEAAKTLMLASEGSREWEHRCGVVMRRISDYLEQTARQHDDAAEGSGER